MQRIPIVGLIALLVLAFLPPLQAPADAAPRTSGKTLAKEVRHTALTRHGRVESRGAPGPQASGAPVLLTSDVIDPGQLFDFIGVHWQAARSKEHTLQVELRSSLDAAAWSAWRRAPEEEDMHEESTNEFYAAPLSVGRARYAQYRVTFMDGSPSAMPAIALTFMDVSDLNVSPALRLLGDLAAAWRDLGASWTVEAATRAPNIRTRQDWSADESLMQWEPAYQPWRKAVVHHTVGSNSYSDAASEIRAIYYYHAITRGWGDIGYNFLVDRFGTIWAGRQGGDDVIGGHAFGWNGGSFGVAGIGDFSVAGPTGAMLGGIAQTIAMEFAQRGIQPLGADPFTHREQASDGSWVPVTTSPPNVLGHRDCTYIIGRSGGLTACPGGALYAQLDNLRRMAQSAFDEGYTSLVRFTSGMPREVIAGRGAVVPLTITNTGRATLPAGGPNPTRVSYRIIDGFRGTTVVGQGSLTPLSADLPPGAAQSVSVTVGIPAAVGDYVLRWDLFAVGLGWFSSVYGTQVGDEWFSATPAGRPGALRSATWYLRNSNSTGAPSATFVYGDPGDVPIAGDWDGSGTTTAGVVRRGTWYLRNSNSSGTANASFIYGDPGDVPLTGDWDGNETTTVGVVRRGAWYLRDSNTTGTADASFIYGDPGDIPIAGDWDGDGTTTVGVVRGNRWYLRNSNSTGNADLVLTYGDPTDRPVIGDWNGDGTSTPGILRGHFWYLRNSNTSGAADAVFGFGDPGDVQIVGDWDGSGTDTPGVAR